MEKYCAHLVPIAACCFCCFQIGLGDVSTDLVDVEEGEEEEPDQEALEDLLGPGATGAQGGAAAGGGGGGVGMGEHPGGRRIISNSDDDAAGSDEPSAAAAAAVGATADDDDAEKAAGAGEEKEQGFDRADLGPGASGGYGLTAFNLKAEREEGYFDEEGNYVFGKDDEEDGAADPWLASEGGEGVGGRGGGMERGEGGGWADGGKGGRGCGAMGRGVAGMERGGMKRGEGVERGGDGEGGGGGEGRGWRGGRRRGRGWRGWGERTVEGVGVGSLEKVSSSFSCPFAGMYGVDVGYHVVAVLAPSRFIQY